MTEPAKWISVGALAEAFSPGNYTPTPSGDLEGRELTLYLETGRAVECRFLSASRVFWALSGGSDWAGPADVPAEGEAGYFALRVRDGIYFVDLVTGQRPPTSLTLLLDLSQGVATVLVGVLPVSPDVGRSLLARIAAGQEPTAVSATFVSASVDAPFTAGTPRHRPTTDLVGRRVEYTYSPTERYEHIYLNENLYTWHCLRGAEKGLADTDRCHYLKLGEDLYLFVWREKIVPTLGAVVADFQAMRTMGKIFGHAQGGSGGAVNFAVGARARLVNVTPGEEDKRA